VVPIKKLGVSLRQSYARVGKLALIKHQRYAHAHQFKRANRGLRKLSAGAAATPGRRRIGTAKDPLGKINRLAERCSNAASGPGKALGIFAVCCGCAGSGHHQNIN